MVVVCELPCSGAECFRRSSDILAQPRLRCVKNEFSMPVNVLTKSAFRALTCAQCAPAAYQHSKSIMWHYRVPIIADYRVF